MNECLRYTRTGAVAHLRLNRPRALNAIDLPLRDALWEALGAVACDPEVRAFVLSGEGPSFCAGADLRDFGTAPSLLDSRHARTARDVWGRLHRMPQPGVAALHGAVRGSGLELALLCDVRLAAVGTTLGLPEIRLGTIPSAGGTQTLPRFLPAGLALEMILTGTTITAETAAHHGLVSAVVPGDRLVTAALELAGRLAALPPALARGLKAAVVRGLDLPLAAGLRLEQRLAAITRAELGSGEERP